MLGGFGGAYWDGGGGDTGMLEGVILGSFGGQWWDTLESDTGML